jgi:hypothetical protein
VHRRAALGAFAGLTFVVLARNPFIFTTQRFDDGDFAANSFLIDQARHGRLLIGIYSRLGFSHPGPALLYVQAIAQRLFHDWIPLVPGAYNAQLLGMALFDIALVAACVSIAVRQLDSIVPAFALPVVALLASWAQPGLLSSSWMSDVYAWPFLLFLVAGASVLAGSRVDLPWLVFASSLLVHGHVSFIPHVVAMTALVVTWYGYRLIRRGEPLDMPRRTLIASSVILGVMALPIALNVLLHWPGPLGKYWLYARSTQAGGRSSADALAWIRDVWTRQMATAVAVAVIVAAYALAGALPGENAKARRFLRAVLVTITLGTAMTFLYARRGVDDLGYTYLARFYQVVPALTVMVAVGAIALFAAARAPRETQAGLCIVLLLAGLFVARTDAPRTAYRGAAWVPSALAAAEANVPGGGTLAFSFSLDMWPPAAGIIEEARRTGRRVCVAEPAFAFIFTDDLICNARDGASRRVVLVWPEPEPPGYHPGRPTYAPFYAANGFAMFRWQIPA